MAVAAWMNVVITIAPSTAALKNASRWSLGNGLSRRFDIIGSRAPLPTKTRNTGAFMIQGMSGMVSTIVSPDRRLARQ